MGGNETSPFGNLDDDMVICFTVPALSPPNTFGTTGVGLCTDSAYFDPCNGIFPCYTGNWGTWDEGCLAGTGLNSFNNGTGTVSGVWSITINDNAGANQGVLNDVQLVFATAPDDCSSVCPASVGTFNNSLGSNEIFLCNEQTLSVTSNDDYILPPPAGFDDAGIGYAIYNCPPTTSNPDTDPCFTDYFITTEDFSETNQIGNTYYDFIVNNPLSLVPTGNDLYFVPITLDDNCNDLLFLCDANLGNDVNNDSCFDIGTPIHVTYLEPVEVTFVSTCDPLTGTGSIDITYIGGLPAFNGSDFTLVNNGDGVLSTTTTGNNTTVTLSGLNGGDIISIGVSDTSCVYPSLIELFNCGDDVCLINSNLTANPPLSSFPNNQYPPNTTVEFCFDISQYNQTNVNFLHGIVPSFGPAWDASTVTPTLDPTVAANNEPGSQWSWFAGNTVDYNSTSALIPDDGWWFQSVNSPGYAGNINLLDPNDSWGDGCTAIVYPTDIITCTSTIFGEFLPGLGCHGNPVFGFDLWVGPTGASDIIDVTMDQATCENLNAFWVDLGGGDSTCAFPVGTCYGNPVDGMDLNWNACFEITTILGTACTPNQNADVEIKTYADGETGIWTDIGCIPDVAVEFPATLCCIPPPTAAPQSFCENQTIAVAANSNGFGTVDWYNVATGGIAIVMDTSTYYPGPLPPGSYTFYAEANDNGCTSSIRTAVTVTINPLPTIVIDQGDTSICANQVPYNILTTVSDFTSIMWNDIGASTTDDISVSPSSTTVYIITATNACGSTSSNVAVSVNDTSSTTIDSIVCDIFTFDGNDYFADALLSDTFTSSSGCDSIINYNFNVIYSVNTIDSLDGCDSVLHEGVTYYQDTVLRDTIVENLGVPCPSLFISEMIEGASFDKCIEIFNGTGAPINLTGYNIQIHFNGNAVAGSTINLSGTIADGGTHVVCHTAANAALLAVSQQNNNVLQFNGNDAIVLNGPGSQMIDLIGNIGCDPGSQWTGVGNGTQNNSIIRLPNYVTGVSSDPTNAPCSFPTFTAANWSSINSSTAYGSFGDHTAYCNTSASFTPHCDSIFETSIVVFSSDSTFAIATSCNPADTGVVSVTNPNTNLCDSVHTITTTLLPTSFATENITACDSTFAAGSWLFASSSFNDTIIGGANNGCDSITTFNVTINSSDSTFATATSCNPADTGIVSVTNTNQANCDSVHTIITSLDPPIFANIDTSFCSRGIFNGNTFTIDTIYNDTVPGGSGGNTLINLFTDDFESGIGNWNLNTGVGPNQWFVNSFYAGAPCNFLGIPIFVVPDVPNQPAGYTGSPQSNYLHITATSNSGGLCDAPWPPTNANYDATSAATNSTQSAEMSIDVNTTGITGVSLDFGYLCVGDAGSNGYVEYSTNNGTTWNTIPGIYNNTASWTNTTVSDPAFDNQASLRFRFVWTNVTSGSDPPFSIDEVEINGLQAGTAGCDSITTVNITILPSDSTFANATSCDPGVTGVFSFTNPNANNCDSTHTITITLLPTSFATENITACDSTFAAGSWLFASSSFNDTIIGGANNGCDSITTFNVTINSSDSTFANATSCNPADTGVVSVTNPNQFTCDSVHTINTTLLQSDSTFANATSCNPADTGVVSATNPNQFTCDSVHTITTTLLQSDSTFANATSCNPADTGVVSVTNPNQFTCDSVHTITTTLLQSDSTFANATSCNPADTGVVSVTNPNQFTCDSVHTITTTLLQSDSTFANATSCNPADTGVVSVTNPNQFTCDSVHTITTTLLQSDSTFANATSCNPADTGVVSVTNPNQFTCDSVHTITTTLLQSDSTFANATSCNPADTGVVSVTNPNQFTCDSVHTITTTLLQSDSTFANATSCNPADTGVLSVSNLNQFTCDSVHTITTTLLQSDSTFANATSCNPADTGVVSVTNPNQFTCDSVHTITTTLLQSDSTFANATSCNPADTGVVSVTNPNQFTCDSVHTITTTLLQSDSTFANATSCNPADTGVVSVTNPNQFTCDSVHTITTTLIPTSFATENITACDSTFAAGSWLFASSSFNDTIIGGANNGCDSITTYNVTINSSDSTFANVTSCNPADTGIVSVTNPNQFTCDSVHTITTTLLQSDSTFANATSCNPADTGVVSVTNPNQFTCDSVHTITTTLIPTSFATENITACDSTFAAGSWLFASSSFNDTIIGGANNGCDSITTFNVTINSSDSTFANATSCNPADTGVISVTNPNQFTCDSVHTITTTLLQSDSTFANATSCNPADTGVVSVTNPNQFTCDSVHTITTTLIPTSFATENITACDSTFAAGSWLFASSSFNDTIIGGANNGCDSITTFNVTINSSDSTFANATSCNPADTGIVSVTNSNQFTCDSVHTVTTTLLPSDSTFATATSCNPVDTGAASVTNPNLAGCDSTHTITTTLLPSDSTFVTATSCNPIDTGVVSVTNPNQFTCDSVHTITTTLLQSDSTFANATSCNPADTGVVSVTNPNQFTCDSVHTITTTLLQSDSTFANATSCNPADTGVVSVTNPNQFTCDSVHTITTTLLQSDSTFANATSCNPADTGVVSVTNPNQFTCDSVHTITTTLLQSDSTFANATSCNPADTGVVSVTNPNQFTCDSVHTITTTLLQSDSTFANATSCNPADTGVVSVTNPNQFTCDSVHTITTTLLQSDSTFANATSCNPADTGVVSVTNPNQFTCDSVHTVTTTLLQSDSTFANTTSCNPADTGVVSVTNPNQFTCDSVHTITTTLLQSDSTFANATSCNPADTGVVSVTNPNQFTCDSVHTITTTLIPTSFATENITACDSTFAAGSWLFASSSFNDTIIGGANNGCDSITTYNVTINSSDSTFANVTSCNPADTGIVSVTNPNQFTCDSVHTITTTLAPFSSATENITACDSVLVLGNSISSSVSFEDTIIGGAANGCDSITTFNVTINNSDSTFANATSCNPADTGVVSVTNPNQFTCDSVHTITTTLIPTSFATENITACDSAFANGQWLMASSVFNDTIIGGANNGCDSITTFNVTINSSDSTFANATSCNPADTGVVSVTNPNQFTCDSVHTITTTLLQSDSTFANATSCNPADTGVLSVSNLNQFTCDSVHTITTTLLQSDSTFANATSCNPADTGVVSVTNPNQFTCDSVHTITTTLIPTSFATENITACDSTFAAGSWLFASSSFNDTIIGGANNGCDSITTYNVTINSSDSTFANVTSCNPADTGIVSVTNPNQFTCDSVHTITTTLAPFSSATENIIACDSVLVLGNSISSSVSFEDTIIGGAANGCDSITIFNIVINNSDSTFANATSCNPADTGVVSVTNPNQFTCDSVHTITTTLAPFSSATENITACDSTFASGSWLFASSTFNDTIIGGANNGCDSITTFNVTINSSDSTFANATSCNPADTGVVSVTNPNQFTCDSVHTITTTLAPFSSATENITACDSVLVLGNSISSSVSFEDTIIGGAANGCDSITIFNIVINNSDSTFANATSCNPADTGVVSVTNPNQFTCDSVHTITTTLIPTSFATENITACDSTFAAGSWLFASSSFNDTIIGGANNGCDSITTYNVTINSSDSTFANATSCNPADTGIVSVTNPNQFTCDSVHTITTTLAPFSSATENITACDSVLVLGNSISSSVSFEDTIIGGAANGCDSITIFNIVINNSDSTFANATTCNPADTGVVSVTNPNQFTCDSVHTITTTLIPTSFATENITACDSTFAAGSWLFASSSFNDTIIGGANNGCDSITTYNVTINSSDSTFANATSCNPADTGIVSVTNPNQFTCDSVHTITTTLAPFSSATENITACDSVLVLGNSISSSVSFEDTIIGGAANGCDSITIFNIVINNSDSTFANATTCNPADTGVVSVTNPNQFTCDSVHTITTTLAPFSSATENITACDSVLVLGNSISSSVSFEDTIIGGAANGCDSITIFNIVINNSDSTFANATSCNPADTGVVSVTNPNQFTCDSVHTITTTLLQSDSTFANATSCNPADTGVVSVTNPNQFTCDSVHTITTTLLQSDSTFANATSCNPADTGVFNMTNPNQFTCDSVHTITITLLQSDSTFAFATSCNPADTGVLSVTNPNQFTCDSVHTITTTLAPFSSATENITACDSVQILGSWFFASTSFEDTIVGGALNGCDSITIFNVAINNSSNTNEILNACDSIEINGTWYFTNQDIVTVTQNISNCDSTHTISINLSFSSSQTTNISACNSYTWIDGNTYTASSDSITVILTGSNGCDSIMILDLNISPNSDTTININLCPNEIPFTLSPNIIVDGIETQYFDTLSNQSNCDSLITYTINYYDQLEIDPSYIVANSGDSVEFLVLNENTNTYFNYTSSNGEFCGDTCENYYVYPTNEVNYYYFTIIDTATGCLYGDTMQVDINLYSELNVPNIFTPNGDGQNDVYYCYGKDIVQFELQIFDRWGGRMFITEDLKTGWDGIFNNLAVESGLYIAIIRATGLDGQKYELTQNIKLVR